MATGLGIPCLERAFLIPFLSPLFLSLSHRHALARLLLLWLSYKSEVALWFETLQFKGTGSHHLLVFSEGSQSGKFFKSVTQRTLNKLTKTAN